jgi:hypothetical protein
MLHPVASCLCCWYCCHLAVVSQHPWVGLQQLLLVLLVLLVPRLVGVCGLLLLQLCSHAKPMHAMLPGSGCVLLLWAAITACIPERKRASSQAPQWARGKGSSLLLLLLLWGE